MSVWYFVPASARVLRPRNKRHRSKQNEIIFIIPFLFFVSRLWLVALLGATPLNMPHWYCVVLGSGKSLISLRCHKLLPSHLTSSLRLTAFDSTLRTTQKKTTWISRWKINRKKGKESSLVHLL